MATHIKTFLEQILAEQDLSTDNWQLYRHALSYAKLGDQLDLEDWEVLNEATSWNDILTFVPIILPKYTARWEEAGKPKDWEDWMEALRTAKPNIYHFSFGDSSEGPVGYCSQVRANTPEEAVLKLQEMIKSLCYEVDLTFYLGDEVLSKMNKEEYLTVYFNAAAISVNDIDFWTDSEGHHHDGPLMTRTQLE